MAQKKRRRLNPQRSRFEAEDARREGLRWPSRDGRFRSSCANVAPSSTLAPMSAWARDHSLFALVDGHVSFAVKGPLGSSHGHRHVGLIVWRFRCVEGPASAGPLFFWAPRMAHLAH